MTWVQSVLLFCSMFGFVAMKAFQTRNVAGGQFLAAFPTSLIMATMEVYVIAGIATAGYSVWTVLVVGSAGGFGCMAAIFMHKRIFK